MGQEYNQGWFNAIRMYMAAHKLVLFQVLCQTYLLCKFVPCCTYIVTSGLHIYLALKFIFVFGPELFLTSPD
jgi:hypothetical protein